jgi:hypothetical protein
MQYPNTTVGNITLNSSLELQLCNSADEGLTVAVMVVLQLYLHFIYLTLIWKAVSFGF